jgi:leucyl/phenylalanyl-tRNA---protein transferase
VTAGRLPPSPPIEPPATRVKFPDPRRARGRDVLAVGSDFSPGTLLAAYRAGIFPWPHGSGVVPWCSPDPRAVFPLEAEPHWSRSLRRTLRIHPYEITIDRDFRGVMTACGETRPEGTWIIPEMIDAYEELHRLGWTHSLEVWDGEELVGGIYGIAIGGAFAGESMFHTRTDASKIAFASLVLHLRARGFLLYDVQVLTDHLESLGCVELDRNEYLARLGRAIHADVRFLP